MKDHIAMIVQLLKSCALEQEILKAYLLIIISGILFLVSVLEVVIHSLIGIVLKPWLIMMERYGYLVCSRCI